MSNWKTYLLGDICDDVAMGPFGSNLKIDNFISEGVPVIRGMNLHEGGFNKKNFAFVSEEKANSLKRCLAYPDDLVFTHRGTLGQVGIIPQIGFEKYLVSQSQMRLSVNKKYLYPKYLYYFFKSPLGQKELLKNTSQVGVPAIANPTKSLKQVEITIPDVTSQKEIASILSSLDDKIELNLQMNQTLETIAQAIFKEWFVDFNFPGFDGVLVDGLPKGWRNGSVLDIATLLSGGTPKTDVEEYWNGSINWISAKDITSSNNQFIIATEKTITEIGIKKSATKLLPKFSTIISARGTVGNYCILSKEMAISQSNYGLKSNSNFNYFLFLMVENMILMMKAYSYGTVFDTITTKTFQEMEVTIPDEKVIIEFEKVITPLYEKILTNQFQIQTLTQTRDTLLPKLMSGKIEIK
jgi:type I restriction enzyme S subunit